MTVASVSPMSADEARVATERIRLALDTVSTAWADLADRVADAYQRRADLALGYGSWAEYATVELRPSHELSADIRRELVGLLSAQGMSTRAIAPTVGVTFQQVAKVREQVSHQATPAPDEAERIDPMTGEVIPAPTFPAVDVTGWSNEEVNDLLADDDEEVEAWEERTVPAASKITGLDGKTYTRPEPTKPRRRPLPDVALDAAHALTAAVARMERVFTDDRYPQNREQVARDTRNHLNQALEALHRLADELTQ